MSERLTEIRETWNLEGMVPVPPSETPDRLDIARQDIAYLWAENAALRTRAERAEAANEDMIEQIRSWKRERKQTQSYARAAAFLGVEREKTRELVERLVAWVEQTAGEDIPVVSEARSWLDKDWGATLPKEARPAAVMGFWETIEAERDTLRAEAIRLRKALELAWKQGITMAANTTLNKALSSTPLSASLAERWKAVERVVEAARRHRDQHPPGLNLELDTALDALDRTSHERSGK